MDPRGAAQGVPKRFPAVVALGNVNTGKVSQNKARCLEDRDGDPLHVCKFFVPNNSVPPIRYELNIDGHSDPTTFEMVYRAKMSVKGAFKMNVQAKRLSDGASLTLGTLNVSTGYSSQTR